MYALSIQVKICMTFVWIIFVDNSQLEMFFATRLFEENVI